MRELFLFAIGASITLSVFLISLVELLFTSRRHKAEKKAAAEVAALKTAHEETLKKLTEESEAKLKEVEKQVKAADTDSDKEIADIRKEYEDKIAALTEQSKKALAAAKTKSKKFEEEAKAKAEEYMKSRQREVEDDLMNLVLSVAKKVLPSGIGYAGQKTLVMEALKELKAESDDTKNPA